MTITRATATVAQFGRAGSHRLREDLAMQYGMAVQAKAGATSEHT